MKVCFLSIEEWFSCLELIRASGLLILIASRARWHLDIIATFLSHSLFIHYFSYSWLVGSSRVCVIQTSHLIATYHFIMLAFETLIPPIAVVLLSSLSWDEALFIVQNDKKITGPTCFPIAWNWTIAALQCSWFPNHLSANFQNFQNQKLCSDFSLFLTNLTVLNAKLFSVLAISNGTTCCLTLTFRALSLMMCHL